MQGGECYMLSPYTNVFYINLNWLRGDTTTQTYMEEVGQWDRFTSTWRGVCV